LRKKEREVKEPEAVARVIQNAKVLRVGMCIGDEPYVVPVCFGFLHNALYFHCAPEGKKLDFLRENGKVCFELEDEAAIVQGEEACGWSIRYTSIIGMGIATILEEKEQKVKGLDSIMKHYGGKGPFHYRDEALAEAVVVRIEVLELSCKTSH